MPKKDEYPLISVIVPVYRVQKYLEKCIDSILNQTYKNLEIILVDDGSDDACPEICDKYTVSDVRVHVIHKENGGLSSARNIGLDVSTGVYVCFVDSDDWIFPEMIQKLYKLLIKTDSDIAQCCAMHNLSSDKKNGSTEIIIDQKDIWESAIFGRIGWVVWLRLYKRSIWEQLRFEEGYYFEDILAFPDIVEQCKKYAVTTEKLYWYNRRENGILRKRKNLQHIKSKEYLYEKLEQYFIRNDMIETIGAFYFCLNIPGYRNGIYEGDGIGQDIIRAHNYKMHRMFKQYYLLARKSAFYDRISTIRKIEWILYYISPRLSYRIVSIYRILVERKVIKNE